MVKRITDVNVRAEDFVVDNFLTVRSNSSPHDPISFFLSEIRWSQKFSNILWFRGFAAPMSEKPIEGALDIFGNTLVFAAQGQVQAAKLIGAI